MLLFFYCYTLPNPLPHHRINRSGLHCKDTDSRHACLTIPYDDCDSGLYRYINYGQPRYSTISATSFGVKNLADFLYPFASRAYRSGMQRFIHAIRWFTAVCGLLDIGKYIMASSLLPYALIEKLSIYLRFV